MPNVPSLFYIDIDRKDYLQAREVLAKLPK